MKLYDAHNHLQDEWLAPHLEKIALQLPALGLRRAVVNGTCETDWPQVAELAKRFPWVCPSFGVHPWLAGNRTPAWRAQLEVHLAAAPSAYVGEIGIDRWMLDDAKPDDPRLRGLRRAPLAEQVAVFAEQVRLAAAFNRPATIHCLHAWGTLAEVLKREPLPSRGFLLHAYGGPAEMVGGFVERGAYFSFNGYFLGPRKERQQQVFRMIPAERLLVETDAPSMPLPAEWRTHKLPRNSDGQIVNHPGNLEAVYTGLAALRGVAVADLADQVEANFQRLFGSA